MSQPEIAGEQEIDFGRYWLAIVRRWWLPIGGLVLGAIVGVLAQTGGARPYQADTTVYLGQPFAPGTAATPIQTQPTQLGFVQQLVTARPVMKSVGTKVGIAPARLRAAVTTKAVGVSSGGKQVSTPIVQISVTYPSARKAVDAAALIADSTVKGFSTYVDVKLSTYQQRIARNTRELTEVIATLDTANKQQSEALADRSVPQTERLLVLANLASLVQFNELRRQNLEQNLFTLRDQVALGQQVERARVIQPASAHRISAPSKRSGGAVGLVIGFVLGLLGAILWEPLTLLVKRARAAD
jgi:uncharacterized protein involved in exopolysaccharide biosynthesis